ncbi:hypothetical protein Tco_1020765, partial [Tanacetum coccineum]
MKRISRGYSGIDFALFPTMISPPETSPSRITSSPSLSPQHTPVSTLSTLQPPNTQPTPNAEEAVLMPYESPLHSVHSLGRDEGRQDVMDLYRLVEERYATSRPERYDLMLWGNLKILFQPDEEDEVWRHQHEYNLISWSVNNKISLTKDDPEVGEDRNE